MQLFYIRHAQSTNNAIWTTTGKDVGRSHDPEVTETGRKQAEATAELLARADPSVPTDWAHQVQNRGGFGLTHLHCSLMVRAVATGSIIASRLGLPLHAWVDWHEEGGLYLDDEAKGERVPYPGYGRSYFAEKYPALVVPETLDDNGWWGKPFEEDADRPARGRRVLAELKERYGGTDARVGIISHGGFYNHFLAAIYGLPGPSMPVRHAMNNCALSRFVFEPEWSYIAYQNRADHLPNDLLTV
jgi:2,3-bisphosphoglycerate-dependent phosphoglycerate mutase